MIKTVLITGIAGFLGSHLAERLIHDGYAVVGLKLADSDLWRLEPFAEKLKLYDADSRDFERIFTENKIDCIIHLATYYTKDHPSPDEMTQMIDANIKSPTELCELADNYNVRYFINTGTFFEYKLGSPDLIQENDERSAYNFYAATKIAFSELLRFFTEKKDLTAIDFKLFAPFGEKDNEKLIVFLVKSLLDGSHVEFSGGEQAWNFTYVDDIIEAYACALKRMDGLAEKYTVLNVGSGSTVTIREIVEKLEKISGKKLDIEWGAKTYRENEIFHVNCDNSRLKKVLGWEQKFDVDSGLEKTYRYYATAANL
ncbi:MAG: hypothetical protein A2808_01105 [Candidatus Moranbacteria bacterium RIFCSPHIGHO2_01_FULL_55_24]|nr:MAG: hypothetical protein A2808_01105 [Candidatus Moranbacteria bacterium RIFCSPHIGHO2_01_FULL_55_24]